MQRRPVRTAVKWLWAGALRISGVLALARRWVASQGVVVLTFHRVLTDDELVQTASLPGMIVRKETFEKFVEYASSQCSVTDLTLLPDWEVNGRLKLAITFDDGWGDNATNAYPAALRHGVGMTIFIVPRRTGAELPFWPEQAAAAFTETGPNGNRDVAQLELAIEHLKRMPSRERERQLESMKNSAGCDPRTNVDRTMSWEQIAELQAGGVAFGSHTSTHEILTMVPLSQAQAEVTSSREVIEGQLGRPCRLFAYPNGNSSPEVRNLVAQAGYSLAFTNQVPDVWTRDSDPFCIPRTNVCEYHLVDATGRFSPVMFDYAVVLSVAKGRLLHKLAESWKQGWRMVKNLVSAGNAAEPPLKRKA